MNYANTKLKLYSNKANSKGKLKMHNITEKERERKEKEFWINSKSESPQADSIENIINKIGDCEIFIDIVRNYSRYFEHNGSVLELGGGQGWASCILKKLYPSLKVTLTDISEHAIQSLYKWEHIFNVKIDNSYSCAAYDIKEVDSSIDIIFCFAAAHHFTNLPMAIKEIRRVLKPNAHCFFFYEPTCNSFFYKFAYHRVNKKRPDVPEDVLIHKNIRKLAESNGLKVEIDLYPSLTKRKPIETLYYFTLRKFPFLQKVFPCTANFHFQKKQ